MSIYKASSIYLEQKQQKRSRHKVDWKWSYCVDCYIIIGRCDLPYDFVSKNQKEQSYKACMDLKRKALFIKLNCEYRPYLDKILKREKSIKDKKLNWDTWLENCTVKIN